MFERFKGIFKKEDGANNKFDRDFKLRVVEAFKEFEDDEDTLILIECNILKCEDFKALNEYLYYTLRELYLFEVPQPICYLLGGDTNIKTLTYWEMLNGVTRLNY